jgi:hypothetical protein
MKILVKNLYSAVFQEGTYSRYNPHVYIGAFKRFFQRLFRGWDDSDLWGLDLTCSEFMIPRLKRFKLVNDGHPSEFTEQEWNDVLDKIINAFELVVKDDKKDLSREERILSEEGLLLFAKYFRYLWW